MGGGRKAETREVGCRKAVRRIKKGQMEEEADLERAQGRGGLKLNKEKKEGELGQGKGLHR